MNPDRCYWAKGEDGLEVLIPHCWGTVLDGPSACTCDIAGSRLERAERGRQIAESYVERLRDRLLLAAARYEEQLVRARRLHEEIRRLEALVGKGQ